MYPKMHATPEIAALYRYERKENPFQSAKQSLQHAHWLAKHRALWRSFDWRRVHDVAEELDVRAEDLRPYGKPIDDECVVLTIEGFTVVVFRYGDEDSNPFDDDGVGKFIRHWQKGAIRNPNGVRITYSMPMTMHDVNGRIHHWHHFPRRWHNKINPRKQPDYFVEPRDEEEWYLPGETYAGMRAYYDQGHQSGMSRGVRDLRARQSVKEQWEQFDEMRQFDEHYGSPMLGVAAVVVYAGEVSSECAVWGIYAAKSEDDYYVADCIMEEAGEAVAQFRDSAKAAAREADAIQIAL